MQSRYAGLTDMLPQCLLCNNKKEHMLMQHDFIPTAGVCSTICARNRLGEYDEEGSKSSSFQFADHCFICGEGGDLVKAQCKV